MADGSDAAAVPAERPRRSLVWRAVALVALVFGLLALGRLTGAQEHLTAEKLRHLLPSLGAWGIPLFIALFALGELVHIPGMVFVAGAVYSYGRLGGAALSYVAAVLSVLFSFLVVRFVGGRMLEELDKPLIRRALSHLDERPLRTVFVLRTIFFMAPPLNYALALSSIGVGTYVVGSALGLVAPIFGMSYLLEWLFAQDLRALLRTVGPFALAGAALVGAALLWLRRDRIPALSCRRRA